MLSTLKSWISRNPIRSLDESDRKIFFYCFVAAFFFWLILNLSREYTIPRQVSVGYRVDAERTLVGTMPELIQAEVRGSGWNLIWESLRSGPLSVEVDVRGKNNLRLTAAEVRQQVERRLSSGALDVADIAFESVPILTTPTVGLRVPIEARVDVKAAPGFVITDSLRLLSDSVTLSGAEDVLENYAAWPTQTFTLADLRGPKSGVLTLAAPPEGVTLSLETVRYAVGVEAAIEKTFTVPIRVVNAPQGDEFQISPTETRLRVSIVQSAYTDVKADDFDVVADLSGVLAEAGRNSVPVTLLRRPEAVRGWQLDADVVDYYLIR